MNYILVPKSFLLDHYINELLESFNDALHCFSTLLCQCHFRQNFGSSSSEESKLNLFHFIDMSSLINKSPKEFFGGKVLITLSPPPPPPPPQFDIHFFATFCVRCFLYLIQLIYIYQIQLFFMPNLIDQWKALCINYLVKNKTKNDATTNCCTPNPSRSGASKVGSSCLHYSLSN